MDSEDPNAVRKHQQAGREKQRRCLLDEQFIELGTTVGVTDNISKKKRPECVYSSLEEDISFDEMPDISSNSCVTGDLNFLPISSLSAADSSGVSGISYQMSDGITQSTNPVSASIPSPREYKCECGICFSRRGSLSYHQSFCDAVSIKKDSTAIALLSPVSKQPQLQPLEQADPFAQAGTTSVSDKPQDLNVADPFAHATMSSTLNRPPQELNVADPIAHATMSSVSNKLQELNVADPVAQIAISLCEALAAAKELMADLKLSGLESDLAASVTKQVIFSVKRAQNLLSEKMEMMFHKVLLPMDVAPRDNGKLKFLAVPKVFAEKYFPKLLSSVKSLLLKFEDLTGKSWTFQYSYRNTYQCYALAEGWSLFVEKKQLSVGDTVFFYRGVGGTAKYKFFIHWNRRVDAAKQSLGNALHLDQTLVQPALPSDMIADNASAPFSLSHSQNPNPPCNPSFDVMVVDDAPRLFTPTIQSLYSPLNNSFVEMVVDDALEPSSPSLSLSPGPSLDKSFVGMTANDALCYCALFPHNYEFEKDMVVQLWMAHGVFVKEPMERIADLFFEDCLARGYLLFCRTDLVTGKAMYKFKRNGSIVSLLISSSSRIVLIEGNSNLNDVSEAVSHLSIRCYRQKNYNIIQELKRFKHLRTLMFLHGHELSFKQVPRDIFLSLRLLQVLDLSQTHLLELPSSIGNMKCLRYLDLSETLIKRLPEAIDCLEKLQTLKLRGCLNLSFLPKGMRKLVNLRHLDLDVCRQLRSMPPGLGTLIHIQTLSAFLVDLEEECSIRQLQNMNNLSGSFCISRLENVLTKDEAMEACLCNKSQLTKLELQWSDTQDEDVSVNGEILSSLKPNTSLEELQISCFDGFDLPSWICDPAFSKLVGITLFKCENCLVLPSLGQLPSLKFLNIVDFYKLKVIDHNFYGGLGIQRFIAFRKLEKLAIENMLSLEKWTGMEKYAFPCLLTLTVKNCPKLSSLQTLSNLCFLKNLEISHCDMLAYWTDGRLSASVETLIIEDCPMISVEFLKNRGQDWHKVAHIQNLWVDNQEIPSGAAE